MFNKLRNKIIVITMAVTTGVLILAGVSIMFFSSAIRPEPKPRFEIVMSETNSSGVTEVNSQELREYIKVDRKEGNLRLFFTMLCVGIAIEIIVFMVTYYLSEKIVAPVKDSYDKQKLFIANASHELKTPLAVIQANMEALEVDNHNQKWKDNIETEITHANRLVLNLLQLARMDAGTIERQEPEKVDLARELQERIDVFAPRFGGRIKLKTAKEAQVNLPKQDLLQVVDILLDNAIKYGDKKIVVDLTQNRIAIENDGTKIAAADIERIFDRFYQTDKTREGSGLGLAIAKAVCEKNSWKIYCESGKQGTRFVVEL